MKRKIVRALLAVLVVCAMTLALTACEDAHVCNDKCTECGLCLSECKDAVCAEKCQGHTGNSGGNDDEEGGNGGNGGDGSDEAEGFAVTFVCDEHVTVYVYETQDMSSEGTQSTTAYSRDGDTGALLDDGNGQVNFKLVFAKGYKLANIDVDPEEGYNNLKGSADTGVPNGYRITKITANLTVTVASESENAEEDLTQGYKITFEHDEHVSVVVYKTQDMTSNGETTDIAYSRESGTGTLTKDGEGQVNFVLVFEEGYELSNISATAGAYKNIKYPNETEVDNGYRITKISDELTVTITTKQVGAEEDLTQGYEVVFECGEHVKIIVYRTQDTTVEGEETNVAYSRDSASGALLKDGNGQVNFKIVCDEGYEVTAVNIVISGEYNQIKAQGDGVYRITKIASNLTITITATAVSAGE